MWLDIAEAPADVPATTAPCRNRSRIASARRVPPIVDDSRSWLPPVRKTPVASRTATAARLVVGLRAGHGVERPDPRDAQLPEDAPVALAGLEAERGRGADDGDRRVVAAGERDESAQDDPVADLVLRAADDDDGSLGHRPPWAPTVLRERIPARPAPRRRDATAMRACENARP